MIDPKYPLMETKTENYTERTRLNILHSDGTLILYSKAMDRGTALTAKLCNEMCKAHMIIDLEITIDLQNIQTWLEEENIKILNIAGSRESFSEGIYQKTVSFLHLLFQIDQK